MTETEPIKAVIRMQDFIHQNINNELKISDICSVAGYSKRHSLRLFKELLNKTVFEYIRDLRLVNSAGKLIDSNNQERILEIALDSGFDSHDGFTKAFKGHFGILPQNYRNRRFPDNYTAPTPMSCYYLQLRSKGVKDMSEVRTVTATFITKPARKLIVKRGILSTDYFSYCDEMGCDIWDILERAPNRLEQVSFVHLPEFLITEGTSKVACAVELPLDYNDSIPEGCDIIELVEHTMLWFNGAPYEDENWYGFAHAEVENAIANYKPELYGYRFAYDSAPVFTFPSTSKDGCRVLVPVVALNNK